MLIMLEDKPYPGTFSTDAPFMMSLAKAYAFCNNYLQVSFPSLPGYLAISGGDTFGFNSQPWPCNDAAPGDLIADGCSIQPAPTSLNTLAYLFDKKGLTWKAYEEDIPCPAWAYDYHHQPYTDLTPPMYSANHNPWIYYRSIYGTGAYPTSDPWPSVPTSTASAYAQAHIVDFNALKSDLANHTLPNFAQVEANENHVGGDYSSLANSDAWVKSFLTPILNDSVIMRDTVVFITYDDTGHGTPYGTIYGCLIGNSSIVKQGYVSNNSYNHFSLVATIEAIFALGNLGRYDASAPVMSDLFASLAPTMLTLKVTQV